MPTFCKIFQWGNKGNNGKKDSKGKNEHKNRGGNVHPANPGAGPSKHTPLHFQTSIQGGQVYPETIDEGESCPYWTHMSCSSSQDGSAPRLVHAIVQPFYSTTGSSVSSAGSRYDLRNDSRAGSRSGSRPHTPGGPGSMSSMSRPMSPSSRPHTPGSHAGSVVSGSFCGSASQTPPPLPPHHPYSPVHQQPSAGVIRSPPGSVQYPNRTLQRANQQHVKYSSHHQSPYHTPYHSPLQSPAHSINGVSGRNSPHFPPNSPLPPIPSQSPNHAAYHGSHQPQIPHSRSHHSAPYHSQPHIPPAPQSPLPPIPGQPPQNYPVNQQFQHQPPYNYHNSPHPSPLRQATSFQQHPLRHSSSHHNALHRSGSAQFPSPPGSGYRSTDGSPVHYPSNASQHNSPHHVYHTAVRHHSSRNKNTSMSRDARINYHGTNQHQPQLQQSSQQFDGLTAGNNSSANPMLTQANLQNYLASQMKGAQHQQLQQQRPVNDEFQAVPDRGSVFPGSGSSTPGSAGPSRIYDETPTTARQDINKSSTDSEFSNDTIKHSTKKRGDRHRKDTTDQIMQVADVRYTQDGYIVESNYSQPLVGSGGDLTTGPCSSPTHKRGPFPPPPQRPPPPPPSEEGKKNINSLTVHS